MAYLRVLQGITISLVGLFVVFTLLVYVLEKGFMTPFGGVYLLALLTTAGVTIRMRETIQLAGAMGGGG